MRLEDRVALGLKTQKMKTFADNDLISKEGKSYESITNRNGC